MGLPDSFDLLSDVVEQFDARDRSVRNVDVTTDTDRPDALDVTMTVPVSLCAASSEGADSSLSPKQASLSENGGLTVTVAVSDLLPDLAASEHVVDIDEQAVHVEDRDLVMTVSFRIEPAVSAVAEATRDSDWLQEGSSSVSAEPETESLADRLAAARSDDVPPYDDTDYLSCLYESCSTFTEMSEHIEMDVAAETVRRYMIEADIHDPDSYETTTRESVPDAGARESESQDESDPDSADTSPEDESPEADVDDVEPTQSPATLEPIPDEQFVADGIGLPDGVAVEDIVDAVADSTAVYEVERSLDLDRGQARDLLKQLNLLDLVLHRLDGPQQEVSKNDIVKRIRQCATGEA